MAQFAKTIFPHVSYAAFRPSYPDTLYNVVLGYHQGPKNLCVDLGTGHGVVARALASRFTQVIGTDPSSGMIEQARSSISKLEYSNVSFSTSSAEHLPFLKTESVDLIVAGQAAHWFDATRLWPEMNRVVRKNGSLAFWGYKDPVFTDFPNATKVLDDYAYGKSEDTLGPYWSQPGRGKVQNKFRDIQPPETEWNDVQRIEYEPGTKGPRTGEGTLFLSRRTAIGDCLRYVRTWSSFSSWQESHLDQTSREQGGQGDIVDEMFDKMREAEPTWQVKNWLEMDVEMEWGSGLLMARRR